MEAPRGGSFRESELWLLRECQGESRRASSDSTFMQTVSKEKPKPSSVKLPTAENQRAVYPASRARMAMSNDAGILEKTSKSVDLSVPELFQKASGFSCFLSSVLMRNVLMFSLSQGKQNADIQFTVHVTGFVFFRWLCRALIHRSSFRGAVYHLRLGCDALSQTFPIFHGRTAN